MSSDLMPKERYRLDFIDWVLVVGVLSASLGAALIYGPAGLIVFGVICIALWLRHGG